MREMKEFRLLSIILAAAGASITSPEVVIRDYCEPVAGQSAAQVGSKLQALGFKAELLAGQRGAPTGRVDCGTFRHAEDVLFSSADERHNISQGFAIADRWAQRHAGAVRGTSTKGPDGSPVRVWGDVGQNVMLIASQQTAASGQKVMVFIIRPIPKRSGR